MSPNEKKALTALAVRYSEDYGYLRFATIASESGLERHLVRRTVRSLARKGLAEYSSGLWTDEGTPAGAGYRATKAGLHIYWNEINPPPALTSTPSSADSRSPDGFKPRESCMSDDGCNFPRCGCPHPSTKRE